MEDLTLQQLVALHGLMSKVHDEGWLRNKLDLMVAFLVENNHKEAMKIAKFINQEINN
jgi:hypothetical protein